MIGIKGSMSVFAVCFFIYFTNCNAHQKPLVEEVTISPQLKERIIASSLKANLRRNDGKKFIGYLYAEDEINEEEENDSCLTGDSQKSVSKSGHFYIYLYDINFKKFLPYRTKVFSEFKTVRFNVEGAGLIVLSGEKQKKSDILLISQFGFCYTNIYEAYGFSESNSYLSNYMFVAKNKKDYLQFSGLISSDTGNDKLYTAIVNNGIDSYTLEMYLYLSKHDGKLHFRPELFN